MGFIEWKNTYNVGDTRIDIQHRHLVNLINMLHAGVAAHTEVQVISSILDELSMYVIIHFNYEEKWMEEHGYPELPDHKLQHEDLQQQLENYKEKFNTDQGNLSDDLCKFLHSWLIDHILEEDKKLSDYV